MNKYLKIFGLASLLIFVAAGCHKIADLPFNEKGTAVTLSANKTAVVPTPADSITKVINFSWTTPNYAQDSSLYKFVLEIDTSGRNFAKESTKIVTGVLTTSLSGKELNAILLNFGFALGAPVSLDVRVSSSYGNNNEKYLSNVLKITVTPYNDPSVLTTEKTNVTGTLANANLPSNTFAWSTAFNGYAGNVTYSLQYDSVGKNFVAPITIPVGVNFYSKSLSQGEMNETALNSGIPGGNTGKVEYRLKAVTALGATSYSNVVMVTINSYLPILRFYMPGSYQAAGGYGPNDWEPATAPEFIRDLRTGAFNNLYYMYIYLPAGAQFKITQDRSWNINYGGTGGNLSSGGANFSVASSGVYRIVIDRSTMKYDIRAGRMGFVGGATGAGWNPPNVYPSYAMGAPATNLFVGLTTFSTGGWKLIDNDSWNDGSLVVTNTRSYGSNGASGSTLEVNGANMPDIATAERKRVIWDGRDVNNVKYEISPATEMRVVGDGMQGVNAWDPSVSPQMTYAGNGVWTLTLNLVGNKDIKFLAGNGWGAFDYEDNSGGLQSTGVPRKIKWEGGSNFKTPSASGSYTITLNENLQTVTIN